MPTMSNTHRLWLAIQRALTRKKISNRVVTMSSAAILAVYAAGYERTKPAADRFIAQAANYATEIPSAAIPTPSTSARAANTNAAVRPVSTPLGNETREPQK